MNLLLRPSPLFGGTFRHVYRFILQAVKGKRAAADAIFEDYLAGKLSEELLTWSIAARRTYMLASEQLRSPCPFWPRTNRWDYVADRGRL
jgi:hypothetical protein